MKCSNCGGLLIWDYERGEVVCSVCGLVQERLTSLEVHVFQVPESGKAELTRSSREKRAETKSITSREYKRMVKLYKEGTRLTKNKPWLEVDYEKVFEIGRFVRAVMSRASRRALKNIEANGYWKVVREGLEHINSINPAYLARSERGKYALAYMVAMKLKTGKYPSKEDVISIFNISDTSYRRLQILAERLVEEASKR